MNKQENINNLMGILLPLLKSQSAICQEKDGCEKCIVKRRYGICQAEEHAKTEAIELIKNGYGNLYKFALMLIQRFKEEDKNRNS